MTILVAVFLTFVGLAMGSFVGAVSWRIHTKRNFVSDRSECEHCHHKLGPLDLIPVVSWAMLGGKCRYCHKPIGIMSPITELALGGLFLLSFLVWPLGFATWQATTLFGLWLIYLVMLGILVVYDLRWMLLPDVVIFPLIAVGFADAALRVSLMPQANIVTYITYIAYGIVAMAGFYWLLYIVSKGRWIGFGDIKLAIFMGVILGWQKTFLVLILANVIGLLILAPGLATKKLTPKSHVPFGPFLIIAFVIAGLFGDTIINWYLHSFVLV